LFIEKLVQSNITCLTLDNLIERTGNNFFEPKLIETSDNE